MDEFKTRILRIEVVVGELATNARCDFQNANSMEQLGMWRMVQEFAEARIKATMYPQTANPPPDGGNTQTFTVHKN